MPNTEPDPFHSSRSDLLAAVEALAVRLEASLKDAREELRASMAVLKTPTARRLKFSGPADGREIAAEAIAERKERLDEVARFLKQALPNAIEDLKMR
jgi:hypothetical protein